jgi:hypothetical protein
MGGAPGGKRENVEERRTQVRRTLDVAARVAAAPEQRLPQARCVDISRGGLLMSFDEPIAFPGGHRLVVSLELPQGQFHALGTVVRTDRGDDFRTYVALRFLTVSAEDYDELEAQLDGDVPPVAETDDHLADAS